MSEVIGSEVSQDNRVTHTCFYKHKEHNYRTVQTGSTARRPDWVELNSLNQALWTEVS